MFYCAASSRLDIDIPTSFHLTITGLLLTDNNGIIFEVTLYRKIFPRFLRYTRGMVKVKDAGLAREIKFVFHCQ